MNNYLGNSLQIRGAEQYVLQNGKGDGMHFVFVRNGLGLEAWISVDRAGDVSRLSFKGDNMGYFGPCGYVAPQYYDKKDDGFLKSFTAGFFTTCGLTGVGTPSVDEGEEVPMHGNISHIPATVNAIEETDAGLTVKLTVSDESMWDRKLLLKRRYFFSYEENTFSVSDEITNEADNPSPFMILYHCNMGYPLLCEQSEVKIDCLSVKARTAFAEETLDKALIMEKPQKNKEEACFFYDMKETDGISKAGIFSPIIEKGVKISFKKSELPCFTEWKMPGNREYVLGLEPGNCYPGPRDVARKNGELKFINPGETKTTGVKFEFITDKNNL